MKKFSKISVVILCLLISSIVFYLGLQNYREKSDNVIQNNQKYLGLNEKNILNSDVYNEEFEIGKVDDNLRKEFINYTESNLDELTPFPSNNESEWAINKFSFVNNNNFYVEYNDGYALGRILVYCVESKEAINCSRISYFAANNFIWEIDSGDDPFLGRFLQYYEKDKDNNWVKTYKSTEIFYFPVSNETLLGMQQVVDSEINLWRLDPNETVAQDIASIFRYSLEDIKSKTISQGEGEILLEVSHQDSVYEVYLTQPIKKGEDGIWIIQYLKYVK
jgi:hypothetical protein